MDDATGWRPPEYDFSRHLDVDRVGRPSGRQSLSPAFEAHLCIPEDQVQYLPPGQHVRTLWPSGAAIPKREDIVYLTSTSAWVVFIVVHELLDGGQDVRVELWLNWIGASRNSRPSIASFIH